MLEASVRNPARDKVMRKEADIRKACSDFRDPSANSLSGILLAVRVNQVIQPSSST